MAAFMLYFNFKKKLKIISTKIKKYLNFHGELGRQNEGRYCGWYRSSKVVGEAAAALGSVTAALLMLLPC